MPIPHASAPVNRKTKHITKQMIALLIVFFDGGMGVVNGKIYFSGSKFRTIVGHSTNWRDGEFGQGYSPPYK